MLRSTRSLSLIWLLMTACGSTDEPGTSDGGETGGAESAGGAVATGGRPATGGATPIALGGTSSGGSSGAATGGDCGDEGCDVGCGNGRIDPGLGEACDDGNSVSGDGCAADCATVEQDYGCLEPGSACVSLVECGDARLMGSETCDDGNATAGDGCSETCQLEPGYDCIEAGVACEPHCGDGRLLAGEECDPPNPGAGCALDCQLEPGYACDPPTEDVSTPATCHLTVCGDGVREGAEACDDGDTSDGDGCSGSCSLEPDCTTGSCTSPCGDGLRLDPESCDDGNAVAEDGCSASCEIEAGFDCQDEAGNERAELELTVRYRDFNSFPLDTATRHPDFEAEWAGSDVTEGLVNAVLDADGKPELAGPCTAEDATSIDDPTQCPYGQMFSTAENFAQFFRDTDGINLGIPATLRLTRDANGAYVYDSADVGFYPIDEVGFTALDPATEETALADATVNDGLPHDFGFTTEIRYFFQYRGGESLSFSGDDDLWVFINRRLALDVGGLHPRVLRTLDVDAQSTELGLTQGGIYEIALFHAERHSSGSNFRLSLTGFVPVKSQCDATCGDGIVAASEQCDLGAAENIGAYNGCTEDCRRGPFCGDGFVDAPDEACDDGANVTPYAAGADEGCAPGCVPSAYCGDGNVDSLFGEECDDGDAPAESSSCDPDCRLGSRCGDGRIDESRGEECDDGNTVSGDGCSRDCHAEIW